MTIKMDKMRIKNIANLMKSIRKLEDTEVFSGDLWKSLDSRREDTRVYYINDVYPYLLMDTGSGYCVLQKEKLCLYTVSDLSDISLEDAGVGIRTVEDRRGGISICADHFRIETADSDWVTYEFDPTDADTYPELFAGSFIEACKYILDWMS